MLQDLNCLTTRYLEPLIEESFLSDDDMQQLFGSIHNIIRFQKLFLGDLERLLSNDDDVKVALRRCSLLMIVTYVNFSTQPFVFF